jgi:hypothetical protein
VMSAYDWNLSTGAPLCTFSDSFYRTVRESVFQQLTKETTRAQFQEAAERLLRLRDELQQAIYPMHYGALVGRHRCVDHLYREAVARLCGLEIMQPVPIPQPLEPPPPEPQEHSLEDVVENFEQRTDTVLGDEREAQDDTRTTD